MSKNVFIQVYIPTHNRADFLKECVDSVLKQEYDSFQIIISDNSTNNETEKGFPFPYNINITYTFTNNKISLDFDVQNIGTNTFPFGLGWHPYFKTKNINESILNFEAEKQYLVNKNMIPTEETSLKFKTSCVISTGGFFI